MQKAFRKTHTLGNVELWKHPEGHKFIRFKDSPLQGHEIPHPKHLPNSDRRGVNFVTTFRTRVNGQTQRVWAKEAGSEYDHQRLTEIFRDAKAPFARNTHHARILRQLKAAGFEAPETLGILHPKSGRPLMLTTHVEGKDAVRGNSRLEQELESAGFKPQDLHDQNVFETKNGHAIIDASLFGPTDKTKLNHAIEKQKQTKIQRNQTLKQKGLFARILNLFNRN